MTFLDRVRFFFSFATVTRRDVAWILVLQFIKVVPYILFPILSKLIIDQFIPVGDAEGILTAFVIGFVFAILNVVFHTAFATYLHVYFIRATMLEIQLALIRKLQKVEQSYLDKMEKGKLFSKIVVSVNRMGNFVAVLIDAVASNFFTIITACTILLLIKPVMLLLVLVLVPVFVGFNRLFREKFRHHQKEARIATEDFGQAITIFIQTSYLSRIHGEEAFESRKVDRESKKVVNVSRSVIGYTALFGSSINVSNQTLILLISVVSAFFVTRGELLIGEMILFIQYTEQLMNNIAAIINQYPQLTEFSESVDAVKEVFDHPGEEIYDGKKKIETLRGEIIFDKVSFRYPGAEFRPVLKDVTFSIPAGMSVALVGESGSGKSTVIKLLQGLYPPTSGLVRVDGHPIGDLDLRHYRRFFGVVSQDAVLFTGPLVENITHGRPVVDLLDILDAIRRANAYDFIMDLPDKLDERVQEAGRNFSGGQKQRIAIARALYRKPKILILDEATSALDSHSELQVQKAIDEILGQQTTFIIAHRLSTVAHADLILVFDGGEIVERGTHNELIDARGVYAKLLSIQSKYPIEELEALKTQKRA